MRHGKLANMMVDSSKAVAALLKVLRGMCGALPAAEEYVMVHHPAFRVNKKPFGIVGMNEDRQGATVSVNLGKEAQCTLLEDARFGRTPYIGQHGWVTIGVAQLRQGELLMLLTESYRRVANKKQLAALETPNEPKIKPMKTAASRPQSKPAAGKSAKPVERKAAERAKPRNPAKPVRSGKST
jgi:predicted DNA-binding protein (MmcQ/YjbR family)